MILDHLWQSSLFVVLVWLLTLALRRNGAAVRYWLWLAASVKFLIPFSALVSLGSQFGWRMAPVISQPQVSFVMEEMSRASAAPITVPVAMPSFNFVPILFAIWLCGVAIGVICWMRGWLRVHALLRAATPIGLQLPIPVMSSPSRLEPGVSGLFKPVLLLPDGIADRLTGPQLQAILAHELCHVRRQDNLTAAIHMVVETIFWFHPLVWWIRTRLIDERERACDEEVLRLGNDAEVYAASILEACKLYLESPLACVSGVTGSDLKKRIETIVANRHTLRVNFSKKLLLIIAASGAVMGPVAVGIWNAPAVRAQSHAEFDVATVKLFKQGSMPENRKITAAHGSLTMQQETLRECITWAYGLTAANEVMGPDWLDTEQYDIAAKTGESATREQMRAMLQALLAERFKLSIRHTTEQRPLYALAVGKGGPKMREVQQEPTNGFRMDKEGEVTSIRMPNTNMDRLAQVLHMFLDHPVLNKTGLTVVYDFTIQVEIDPQVRMPERGQVFHGFGMTPSIFGAVEALGLKLVSEKGQMDIIVVDHVERPSGNEQAFFRKVLWTPQAFEAASVKPTQLGFPDQFRFMPGGGVSARNTSLKQLIEIAYNLKGLQLTGGPGWLDDDRFDIVTTAVGNPEREQTRLMLRTLLADRFKLASHLETRELPIYNLEVAKNGSKLQKSSIETRKGDGDFSWGPGRIHGQSVTIPIFADLLSGELHRMVIDKTGISGNFDLNVLYTPENYVPRGEGGNSKEPRPDPNGPSVFTAIQEQLGLKLESTKGPVQVLVIDHVEKPSGN